jgi:hypothetical protein
VQQDIRQSRYDRKRVLMHEEAEEVCEENKCHVLKLKGKKMGEEEKIE